jgi:uncharacterized membrane protein YsdA (DUF1294 family)/cold shock CspA family protein
VKKKGRISSWNDDKGYGFITPQTRGDRIFIHIKAFANRNQRPVVGKVVSYSLSKDTRGRPCADKVTIDSMAKTKKRKGSMSVLTNLLALGFLLLVGVAVHLSFIPVLVILIYVVLSSITFSAYVLDKVAAKNGGWRTRENALHLLSLAGGWPGALMAQNYLHHKTKKQPFRVYFWTTVILNCMALVWPLTPYGASLWRSVVGAMT